ncbi:hypothetical protein TU94_14100 [Streptomyces cyaneogriseus subsp. noncyanogenus]|uniref:Uncharacterized protein n=1 Tax=Streptomyces cyaneogriseus subsp. noncyanogenus TaxID=477245 RepID=A0A0C5FXQ8_9ACTN|nr:hypothetical protein TU94_14100 [Streptomyces cyaneogriseus subsp. noncyanogenus]
MHHRHHAQAEAQLRITCPGREVIVKEWTDPRYRELVAAWQRAQQPTSRDPEPRPQRAFIVPRPA